MENKPQIIPKSITETVDKIKEMQANPNVLGVVYIGRRSTGRRLIQQLLETRDAVIVEPLKLDAPKTENNDKA